MFVIFSVELFQNLQYTTLIASWSVKLCLVLTKCTSVGNGFNVYYRPYSPYNVTRPENTAVFCISAFSRSSNTIYNQASSDCNSQVSSYIYIDLFISEDRYYLLIIQKMRKFKFIYYQRIDFFTAHLDKVNVCRITYAQHNIHNHESWA